MSWFGKRMPRTDHRYVEERLSAYLDGELSPPEQQAVDKHLAACEACQWHLDTLRQTVSWTRDLPTILVPRVFTLPVQAQPAPRRIWNLVPLLQGATAVVALLFVFVVAGDIMLTSFAPGATPQSAVLMEQAPAAVQATEALRAMEEAPPQEVEVVVESEKAMPEPLPSAQPTEVASAEKLAVAATASLEPRTMSATGAQPAADASLDATAAIGAAAAPRAPAPEAPLAESEPVSEVSETAPSAEGTPSADGTASSPQPTMTPAPSSTVPAAVAAPTLVAEVEESIPPVPEAQVQRPAGMWQEPTIWLRVVELSLGLACVILVTLTVVAMIQRRRAR